MAQKVKVQCYKIADMLNLKKWVGWGGWVSSRSGWLLELLTELINDDVGGNHFNFYSFSDEEPAFPPYTTKLF